MLIDGIEYGKHSFVINFKTRNTRKGERILLHSRIDIPY